MAYTVTKSGPFYATGEISFSSLRTNFKEAASGSIAVSELRRLTSTAITAPIVPDCTENRTSGPLGGGISSLNDLSISQFRNSIKYYNITQTGTNDNGANTGLPGCDIDGLSWNSNLQYNIVKQFNVNGTIGSYSTGQYAAELNATTYNLYVNIGKADGTSGTIQGASGSGATNAAARTGFNGGPALYLNPGSTGTLTVSVYQNGTILGGGGGGAGGYTPATVPASSGGTGGGGAVPTAPGGTSANGTPGTVNTGGGGGGSSGNAAGGDRNGGSGGSGIVIIRYQVGQQSVKATGEIGRAHV